MRQMGHLVRDRCGKEKYVQNFGEETRKKAPLRNQRLRREDNIKMDLKEIEWGVAEKGTIGELL
jgi:hypothetical protein